MKFRIIKLNKKDNDILLLIILSGIWQGSARMAFLFHMAQIGLRNPRWPYLHVWVLRLAISWNTLVLHVASLSTWSIILQSLSFYVLFLQQSSWNVTQQHAFENKSRSYKALWDLVSEAWGWYSHCTILFRSLVQVKRRENGLYHLMGGATKSHGKGHMGTERHDSWRSGEHGGAQCIFQKEGTPYGKSWDQRKVKKGHCVW